MQKEGLISKEKAVMLVKPEQLDQQLHKQFDQKSKEKATLIARGLPASPGAAVGKAVFSALEAREIIEQNPSEQLILVRAQTSPEDIEGMDLAKGILTSRGGLSSHAAVVSRGMGKCCITGSNDILVNEKEKNFHIPKTNMYVKEGDLISLDGSTGEVFLGELTLVDPSPDENFSTLLSFADLFSRLKVRANAETPKECLVARKFNAQGIGLARTEHMFFGEKRILAMRQMILADTSAERKQALEKLLPFQEKDFYYIFKAMDGFPVTIRLLDPPLHEFLPQRDQNLHKIAKELNTTAKKLEKTLESLHELNPMLGFRGVRLGIVFPEINEMQVRAIFGAAVKAVNDGITVKPEIMIPVLGEVEEMRVMREMIEKIAKEVLEKENTKINYSIGVMMELPRACLTADKIAKYADFFSFGTNDLTQTTYGYSRDDSGKFIPIYIEKGILKKDPFHALDQIGVGELIKIAVKKGRDVRKDLKIGICGEHGGEPSSIEFCHNQGLDYVSCSPYRVPIARLAAAQAAIKERKSAKN